MTLTGKNINAQKELNMIDPISINNKEDIELFTINNGNTYLRTTRSLCNTRRYHGLMVKKFKNPDKKYHVLLSSLDETLKQNGCEYHLGFHKFPGSFYPQGNKYICKVIEEPYISITYCMGPIKLKKDIILCKDEATLLFCYTLLESNISTEICFNPLLAFRDVQSLSKYNNYVNPGLSSLKNGMRIKLYNEYPFLYFQFSDKVNFTYQPMWYYNFEYLKSNRNFDYEHEDLFLPGTFKLSISEGEQIILAVGLDETEPGTLHKKLNSEKTKCLHQNEPINKPNRYEYAG